MKKLIETMKIKKVASIVLTLAMMLSLICVAGTVTTGAITDKVSLYSSGVYFSKYGGTTYEVYVQTRCSARNQEVFIHYNYIDNMPWQDVRAEYCTTLSDGSKIWKATFTSFNTRYAIKLIANGKTYWDNNSSKNYDGSERLGTAPVTADRLGYQYSVYGGYRIDAVLQNYGYHKNVYVRYTTNGWKTCKDKTLSYAETLKDGTERWTATLNIDTTALNDYDFQYAICYRVNGKEYWANNFNENYDLTYYIHH